MSLLTILKYPDYRLRTKALTVELYDNSIKFLIKNMLDTMYQANGIGLAATQINVHKRVIVIDLSPDRNKPIILINPEIIFKQGKKESEEGCLSVPGFYEKIIRSEQISVRYFDQNTNKTEILEAIELLAFCLQHEIDHLDGKLFVDHLSNLKRERLLKKIEKIDKKLKYKNLYNQN